MVIKCLELSRHLPPSVSVPIPKDTSGYYSGHQRILLGAIATPISRPLWVANSKRDPLRISRLVFRDSKNITLPYAAFTPFIQASTSRQSVIVISQVIRRFMRSGGRSELVSGLATDVMKRINSPRHFSIITTENTIKIQTSD